MKVLRTIATILFGLVALLAVATNATNSKETQSHLRGLKGKGPPPMGMLYYEGSTIRTVVPPAATPMEGVDDFYVVIDGVEGQLGITAVAPGDTDYHGGKWAFHFVSFQDGVEPYLLTSDDMVDEAEMAGEVVVTRVPEMDFKCPVQP